MFTSGGFPTLSSKEYNFKPEIDFDLSIPSFEYGHPEEAILAYAEILREYCGIQGIHVGVTFTPLTRQSTDTPGCVHFIAKDRCSIWINPAFLKKPRAVGAVLAHEIAHIYAFSKGISFRSSTGEEREAEEQMTDLLAIALGMGRFLRRATHYVVDLEGNGFESRVGYLPVAGIRYAYRKWQKIRRDDGLGHLG